MKRERYCKKCPQYKICPVSAYHDTNIGKIMKNVRRTLKFFREQWHKDWFLETGFWNWWRK